MDKDSLSHTSWNKDMSCTCTNECFSESRSFRSWHRHRMAWRVHFDVKGLARRSESYLANIKTYSEVNSSSPFLFIRANILKNAGDPQEMGSFVNSCGWVVASPPRRRGPHRPGGDAGVYTDRRKRPLGAVSGHLCILLCRGLGLWVALGSQQCTQMGGSGLSAPFWGVCVHCWAVALLWTDVGTQECTQIGQNGLSAPFWGVCVHCCDASRDTNCDASCARWHERLSRHGMPAAPPRWPLPLGREDRL